jgi:hypothetical protein
MGDDSSQSIAPTVARIRAVSAPWRSTRPGIAPRADVLPYTDQREGGR